MQIYKYANISTQIQTKPEKVLQRGDVGLLGAKADGRGFGEPVASHQYHHVPLCPIICQQHSAQMGRFLQVFKF